MRLNLRIYLDDRFIRIKKTFEINDLKMIQISVRDINDKYRNNIE